MNTNELDENFVFNESFISNVESSILQPLNFIKFEQYNEYFILKKTDINIIDYLNEVKPLINNGINFNLLNYMINISNLSNTDFNIPVSSLHGYGISLSSSFTFSNKIRKFRDLPIIVNDNIKKGLLKCKLVEHLDFEMIRGSLDGENIVDIEFYITKEAFYKIILKKIGLHIFQILVESSTKVIYYYNQYRQKYNSTKMDELHKSMINMTNELHKLTQVTVNHTNGNYDDIISSDSKLDELVLPNNLNNYTDGYDSNRSSDFSISEHVNDIIDSVPILDLYRNSQIHSDDQLKSSRDILNQLRHTIGPRISDLAYTFLDNDRNTIAKTELYNINRQHISKYNKDLLTIHKSFKDVINGINRNRLSVVNNSFVNISENINSMIDSIEYSDSNI